MPPGLVERQPYQGVVFYFPGNTNHLALPENSHRLPVQAGIFLDSYRSQEIREKQTANPFHQTITQTYVRIYILGC